MSVFSQSKDEIIKSKDEEIKRLKEKNKKEIVEKDQKCKIEIDKLNNEVLLLKNIIKESNEYFLKEMFDETFSETYFKTRDLSKTDDSDNFKFSNTLVKSINVEASPEVQKLCNKVADFNTNYLELLAIRENILNQKFDEKKVQEALEKIEKLPKIDSDSKLGIRKQSIRDLLFNYKENICILKKNLDKYKNLDQSAIKPLYDKLLDDPRFKNYPILKQIISDMKKDVTTYTGEDDLLPCLDETQKNIEEIKKNETIPQDTKNKN
ncbi:MAG: hypothetical protein ACK4IX_15435 [Candidatus Sericytochromatia bacterium]